MATRLRAVRTIVGAWGIQTVDGPFCFDNGTPCLYPTKAAALADCKLSDMQPVRVTVRYPRGPQARR